MGNSATPLTGVQVTVEDTTSKASMSTGDPVNVIMVVAQDPMLPVVSPTASLTSAATKP